MIDFKPFTKETWFAYAGAVRFDGGAEPLIADMKVGGRDATAILDGESLSVSWEVSPTNSEDGDKAPGEVAVYWVEPALAGRAAALLFPEMTREDLMAMPGAAFVGSELL